MILKYLNKGFSFPGLFPSLVMKSEVFWGGFGGSFQFEVVIPVFSQNPIYISFFVTFSNVCDAALIRGTVFFAMRLYS